MAPGRHRRRGRDRLKRQLGDGQVLLLENVRFYKEEEKNDPEFARKLAQGIDIFVNDAFGSSHRAHASVVGIADLRHRSRPPAT